MLSGAAGSYGRTLTQGEQCPRSAGWSVCAHAGPVLIVLAVLVTRLPVKTQPGCWVYCRLVTREQKRGGAGREGQETGVTVTVTRYGLTTPLPIFIPMLPQTTVENTNGNGRHHCGCL
ncbi:hypothetical protein F7725_011871 [Dissostichus mawsoni]|uniref:Uncharacterized protein n=1 Tax=Dissostichus mawsoni TaxID=36200 RepID=A0A7J5ZAT5_DISMA|nr:hypothetical protein F7725_011871 [Dissostichus mawsoni]